LIYRFRRKLDRTSIRCKPYPTLSSHIQMLKLVLEIHSFSSHQELQSFISIQEADFKERCGIDLPVSSEARPDPDPMQTLSHSLSSHIFMLKQQKRNAKCRPDQLRPTARQCLDTLGEKERRKQENYNAIHARKVVTCSSLEGGRHTKFENKGGDCSVL
jgi:hypothetical protein